MSEIVALCQSGLMDGSAKPWFAGSNPAGASNFTLTKDQEKFLVPFKNLYLEYRFLFLIDFFKKIIITYNTNTKKKPMEKFFVIVIAVAVVTAIVGLIYQRPKLLKAKIKFLVSECFELEIYAECKKALASSKEELESYIEILDSIEEARILRYLHRKIPSLFRQAELIKQGFTRNSNRFERRMKRFLPKIIDLTAQSQNFEKIHETLSKIPLSDVYTQLGIADDELNKIEITVLKTDWKKIHRAIREMNDCLNFCVPCRREFHNRIPNEEERRMRAETSDTNCDTCMKGYCPFNRNPHAERKEHQPE